MSDYNKYSKTLPTAEKIYTLIKGKPKTHKDWAESFNIIGEITRLILKNKQQ